MAAHHLALGIKIVSRGIPFPSESFHKGAVVPVGNKTDVLAVPLFRRYKAVFGGNGPDLRFCKGAQGKQGVGKHFLGQGVEKIGLILGRVLCLIQ